jgi:hypothetical protein
MARLGQSINILNQKGTPAFYSDIFANRPSYGFAGRVFISTDTGAIYEDTGSAWTLIADAGAGSSNTLEVVTTNGNTTTQGIVISAGNLAIGTATAGAPLDIHTTTGTAVQFNGTTTNNAFAFFQNAGTSKWRIGNLYNAGANSFQVYDVLNATARLTILNTGATTLNGALTSTSIAITGGTSAQFLKADGSVDSNTYVTTNTSQTIVGGITKTFNSETRFGLGTLYDNSTGVALTSGFTTINAGLTGSNTFLQVWRSNAYKLTLNCDLTSAGSTFTFPANQTNALIATATGTSSQLIAGDGTLISAGTNITITGGTISASGGGGMSIGGSITSATAGSVLYAGASGVLAQSNANFYYDYTNIRLGIGTNTIGSTLQVAGGVAIGYSASTTAPSNGLTLNGNVGLGTTGSSWRTTQSLKAIEFAGGGSLWGQNFAGNNPSINLHCNSYEATSTTNYIQTGYASGYQQNAGTHYWLTAPSGTAGASVTFTERMKIWNTGNVTIGTLTDAGYKLDVSGTLRATTSAYFATSSGSVAIGTTTASAKLTILGANTIGGSIPTSWTAISAGRFGIVNGNQSFYFDIFSGSFAELSTYNYSTSQAFPFVLQGNGGNVLINSTTDSTQGVLQVTGGITANDISLTGATYSATATITKNYYSLFTGSTGQTLTLPSPSSNNYQYVIINTTANSVTIAAATSTNIITTTNTSVASITLIANARCFIIADGNNKYYQIF